METTKDSIDWSHVHERYKWMARDKNGQSFLYEEKPDPSRGVWECVFGNVCLSENFASYRRGACDWENSLLKRPKA